MEPVTLVQLVQGLEELQGGVEPADAALVHLFLRKILDWKEDQTAPRELLESLDRTLGHVWFARDETHTVVHRLLEAFRSTVHSLGGMTMNERLVMFDLMERWDRAVGDGRRELYAKLEAEKGPT